MSIAKRLIVPGAVGIAAFAGVAGGSAISSLGAHAATVSPTTTTAAQTAATTPSQGGHVGTNGTKEAALTGDVAAKAKAAAEAAVPGATMVRVENDAEGATYEAHMTKADGTEVNVKMDANFKVTTTETDAPGGPNEQLQQ